MAEFLVKVADERGRVLEQAENGMSTEEIRDRYTAQGYLVYSVKPKGVLSGGAISLPSRRKIRQDQFIVFNQQLVTLIRAGLPILTALELLTKRQSNPYFKSLLQNITERIKGGQLLSSAFEAQGVFDRMYTTTVLAGEKSGNLEEVLNRYIGFQRMTISFTKKLKASLVYPALLMVLVIGMLIFMMTYVVPQFATLYQAVAINSQLPALTQFMLSVGQLTQKYFALGAAVLVGIAVLLWRWSRTESGIRAIDRFKLKLPLLGDIWLKYQVAMFSRTLSTLLSGGLPLVPALETAGSSMQSRYIADGVHKASGRVREGRSLSHSLEETKVFPGLAVEMIEVGESTGALPAMLTSTAEFYEEDVQTALSAAMSLIEPAILIVMGTVVAFVLISLYLPIFTLGAGGVR
jgi:type IV pilus assembly protein PilC